MIAGPGSGMVLSSNNSAFHGATKEMTPMTTFRSLFAAAAAPLTVTGTGENFAVEYAPGYIGSIVCGGAVRVIGNGNGKSQQIAHLDRRFAQQPAGIPVFVGGSEGTVAYLPAQNPTQFLASR
jgi:hypothetical protein